MFGVIRNKNNRTPVSKYPARRHFPLLSLAATTRIFHFINKAHRKYTFSIKKLVKILENLISRFFPIDCSHAINNKIQISDFTLFLLHPTFRGKNSPQNPPLHYAKKTKLQCAFSNIPHFFPSPMTSRNGYHKFLALHMASVEPTPSNCLLLFLRAA